MAVVITLIFVVLLSAIGASHAQEVECDACKFFVEKAEDLLQKNATVNDIFKALDEVCHLFPRGTSLRRDCDALSHTIASEFPALAKGLNETIYSPYAICAIANICPIPCCASAVPEQVHLALTGVPTEMSVTWVSESSGASSVLYGRTVDGLNQNASGSYSTYTKGGWRGFIFTVTLTGLDTSTKYFYKVQNSHGATPVFAFTTAPSEDQVSFPLRFGMIGDMGTVNSEGTFKDLQYLTAKNGFNLLLHNGDISYADAFQELWDIYMRRMESIAAVVPYMVVPGNHELAFNFTSYKSRFQMPRKTSQSETNLFWSVNYGNVHIIGLDTESELDTAQITDEEVNWLRNDLQEAAQNRVKQPWIIAMGHRPLYCTISGGITHDADCGVFAAYLRNQIEDLLYQYKVDLVFGAHKHCYERMTPIYKGAALPGYVNPRAPVYVLNGAAGNREKLNGGRLKPIPDWSLVQVSEYGFQQITVWNNTALQCDFFGDADGQVLLDSFTISKTN